MIFIDKLNILSFLKVIKSNYKKVYILSYSDNFSLFLITLLKIYGVEVIQENFFYGDLRSSKLESLYIDTRKTSVRMSFEYSKTIIDSIPIFYKSKLVTDKNIFKSYLSKILLDEFEYFFRRIDYILNVYPNNNDVKLIIQKSKYISKEFLKKNSKIKIEFLGNNFFPLIIESFKFKLKALVSVFRYLFISKKKLDYHTTLSVATDQIKSECAQRHFPHWLNSKKFKNQVIINNVSFKVALSKKFIKDNNISILGKRNILYLPNKSFKINYNNSLSPHLKIYLNQLLYLSQGLIFLLNKYNCNKFVFSEPQDPISDGIILAKSDYDIETFCIQYSNMCFKTPVMITCADNFCCFSEEYESVFKWNDIGPKKFINTGYSFLSKHKNNYIKSIKDKLVGKGVKYIIAYFDESIQNEKWGFKSYHSARTEYEALADFIIKNKDYAVILKPQFVRNTIAIFNSPKIHKALKTDRLIEIKSGTHRNLITPQQVGSISDFSISDLVGGTAGLESGLAGSIVFFINPVNYRSMLYKIYNESGMLIKDTETVLNLILQTHNKNDFSNNLVNQLSKQEVSIEEALGI